MLAHSDTNPSLGITVVEGGRVLLNCRAGCSFEDVLKASGLTREDLGGGGSFAGGARAIVQSAGLTLCEYAEAKGLPIEFLQSVGVDDCRTYNPKAVSMQYFGPDGAICTTRYRVGLSGERFRWKRGAKVVPYGLWKLGEARAAGRIVIVEGESDAQTLWLHGYPALGLAGATQWKDDYRAILDGVHEVYLLVEPDGGGEALLADFKRSGITDRVRLVSLQGAKDVSDLYLQDRVAFPAMFDAALDRAELLTTRVAREMEERRAEAFSVCRELTECSDILERFESDIHCAGVAGEGLITRVLFLCLITRLFEKPVSVAVKGPSSGGKSFLVDSVLRFFPESAYTCRTAMSERALVYSEDDFSHRFLVLYEAAGMVGEMATYLIRSLLSEGRIDYETVEKTSSGNRPRKVVKEGPTGLILTTTEVSVHAENETRMLSLTIRDTNEHTRQILRTMASGEPRSVVNYAPWHALQEWLACGETRVVIPFEPALGELIDDGGVRMRRDYSKVVLLVRAHALVHRGTRDRNETGAILATLEDYEAVRVLIADLIAEIVESSVSPEIRQTVDAVAAMGEGKPITNKAVAARLGLDPSAASRRVKAAIELGFLRDGSEGRGRPRKLAIGEPMPVGRKALPTVEQIREFLSNCAVAREVEEDELPPPGPQRLVL